MKKKERSIYPIKQQRNVENSISQMELRRQSQAWLPDMWFDVFSRYWALPIHSVCFPKPRGNSQKNIRYFEYWPYFCCGVRDITWNILYRGYVIVAGFPTAIHLAWYLHACTYISRRGVRVARVPLIFIRHEARTHTYSPHTAYANAKNQA